MEYILVDGMNLYIDIFFLLFITSHIKSILIFFCALYRKKKEIFILFFFAKLSSLHTHTHTHIQPVLSYKIKKNRILKMKMCDIFLSVHVFVFFSHLSLCFFHYNQNKKHSEDFICLYIKKYVQSKELPCF
jgi:hypothetical protein